MYQSDLVCDERMIFSVLFSETGEQGSDDATHCRDDRHYHCCVIHLADSLAAQGYCVYYNTAEESLYQVAMTCERLDIQNDFF